MNLLVEGYNNLSMPQQITTHPFRVFAPSRFRVLLGALIAVALLAAVGGGAAMLRARRSRLPPLQAWEGPEAASPSRGMEVRLAAAVQRAPQDASARVALGRFYLDDAKPFEALWTLRDAQRLDPRALQPRLLMARALEVAQLYPPAVEALRFAIQEHSQDDGAPRQLASLQLSLGRPAAAVATLQALARRHPLSDEARLLLARALEASGRDAEALRQYQLCRQAEAEPGEAFFRTVRLLLRTGKAAAARPLLTSAAVPDSRGAEQFYDLGLVELQQGASHEEAARRFFGQALDRDDRFVPAHMQFGLLCARHRDWETAQTAFSQVIELDPGHAEAALQLARVRRAMGDQAGARYYQAVYADLKDARPKAAVQYQAMAAAGDDPRGPLLVSNAYVKMDQQQKAAEVTRAGLRRFPGNVPLTERLIVCDLLTGTAKEAEQFARDWLRRDPASARAGWFLGRVRLTLQDSAGALPLFERAARAESGNAEYQFSIGSVYAGRPSPENWERAARYFGRAVTLQPDEARYRQNLGIALRNIGRLEGARRQFLRAMDLDVNQSAPLNNVVQVARGLKQFDQVEFWAPLVREVEQRLREELPDWKKVWDTPQDPAGYLPLAQFLQRTGELRKARNILEQAVILRPDMAPARQELRKLQRTLDAL